MENEVVISKPIKLDISVPDSINTSDDNKVKVW